MRSLILAILTALYLLCSVAPSMADSQLKIIATLSTFADLAKTIGGEKVTALSVASPKFNPHFIEPRPSDVLKLKRCDLFVHGGLDLEAWRGPLVDAAARSEIRRGGARALDLSVGLRLLEVPDHPVSRSEGDIHLYGNPHYWLSASNAHRMAAAIARKLSELDPESTDYYQENLQRFDKRLNTSEAKWKSSFAPMQGKEVIAYHNEWIYLLDEMGLKGGQFLEPKPGIPPSPRHIEELVSYIKQHEVLGIIQATFVSQEAGKELSSRTGVPVARLCQNVNELDACSDYISTLDYNYAEILRLASHD